jgi:two-component system chemotaxis response regulator CheY
MEQIDLLIVDDSAAIRKILRRVLVQTELPLGTVFEAGDGGQGLNLLKEHRVDVILSDMNMPNMDGVEFLKNVRQMPEHRETPFIMITTEGSQAKVKEVADLGGTCYVKKPFTCDQLRDRLNSMLKPK